MLALLAPAAREQLSDGQRSISALVCAATSARFISFAAGLCGGTFFRFSTFTSLHLSPLRLLRPRRFLTLAAFQLLAVATLLFFPLAALGLLELAALLRLVLALCFFALTALLFFPLALLAGGALAALSLSLFLRLARSLLALDLFLALADQVGQRVAALRSAVRSDAAGDSIRGRRAEQR